MKRRGISTIQLYTSQVMYVLVRLCTSEVGRRSTAVRISVAEHSFSTRLQGQSHASLLCQSLLIWSHVRTLICPLLNMAGKEWPSLLQKLLLLSWMPAYLEAAATGSYAKLWPRLYEAWFKVNPARLARLPDLECDTGSDLREGSHDDEEAPDDPSSERRIALINHLRGLCPEERLAWQVQQGLIQDQAVHMILQPVYHLR